MKSLLLTGLALTGLTIAPVRALHASMIFEAFLTGSQEVGPTGSTATGFGTVILNDAMTVITVNESWSGLTAPASISHIHGPGAVGVNAAVLFPFTGVPFVISGSIPEQSFAITPAQVAQLEAGLFYMNVHTANFPGGEIRGQLALVTPEPGAAGLLVIGLSLFFIHRKFLKHAPTRRLRVQQNEM